jgi:hypothetical protein
LAFLREKTISTNAPAFTIVHRIGEKSETVATGLTRSAAQDWLQQKAKEAQGTVSPDLIVELNQSDETWSAVESE